MSEVPLRQRTLQYLTHVLGPGIVGEAGRPSLIGLPYFLPEAYDLTLVELHRQKILLACAKNPQALPGRQTSRHVQQLSEHLQVPVIVAVPHLTPGERKQLITNGLAFVVPGSQLYAPQLGMILSGRFPAPNERGKALLSPATQAMLIGFLLRHPAAEHWQPSADAEALGYTAMTATRAVRELLQFQLFGLALRGRAKHLKMEMTRRQLWDKVQPHLGSPVQRTLWTYDPRVLQMPDARAAGLSALAQHTLLDAPPAPVVAMTAGVAAQARREGIVFEPRKVADAIEVQIWRYPPTLEPESRHADRLSVWLSLKEETDPRIQMALEEVDQALPW